MRKSSETSRHKTPRTRPPSAPLALRAAATFLLALATAAHAQMLVSIDTVTVGDAGNSADTSGYGAVGYEYRIGKYEVTISQYNTFLNSVASVTSASYIVDLWNPSMQTDLNIAGISRTGSGTVLDPYRYSVIGPSGVTPAGASSPGNRPIAYASWFGAARFANWVNNGATNGATTETGAYTLNGATNGIITKNAGAAWYLPSEDEWYKAAYYKAGGPNAGYWSYPTQSDTTPGNTIGGGANQANAIVSNLYSVTQSVYSDSQNYLTDVGAFSGSASAYGTFDQGGSLWEWNDGVVGGSERSVRGGAWIDSNFAIGSFASNAYPPNYADGFQIGFRLASVPEPSTGALLLMTGAVALFFRVRNRHKGSRQDALAETDLMRSVECTIAPRGKTALPHAGRSQTIMCMKRKVEALTSFGG